MSGALGPRLSPRLAAVADRVPLGARLADIGADHAYLPVALAAADRIASAVAIDVRPGAVAQAQRTVARWPAGARVEVRLGDGLAVVAPGEVDAVVVAGLGGPAIVAILDAAPDVLARVGRLVLAPQSGGWRVRRWLLAHGWALVDEALVVDAGRAYLVVAAAPGDAAAAYDWPGRPPALRRAALLHLGPHLARAATPPWRDHWVAEAVALDARAAAVARGGTAAADRAARRWRRRARRVRAAVAAATMAARRSIRDAASPT